MYDNRNLKYYEANINFIVFSTVSFNAMRCTFFSHTLRKRNGKSIELSFSSPTPAKTIKTNMDQNTKVNTEQRVCVLKFLTKSLLIT